MSKESPAKNCWEYSNPVYAASPPAFTYHVPPPFVIKLEFIDPVAWAPPKLEVGHFVPVISPVLYIQLAPSEDAGRFEYLPVPSSHDWDKAYIFMF